jgi:protein phosphatase
MGGHEFGEIASFMVMRYLLTQWNAADGTAFEDVADVEEYLSYALVRANEHIFHVNKELSIRWAMGTTVTMGTVYENKLIVAHVGDSRAYRLRKGKITQLTVDQNWREEMVRNGVMSDEDAAAHPFSNMLTNCVGAMRDLRIDFKTHTMAPGDRYLFCTDGLSSLVSEEDLQTAMVDTRPAADTVRDLVRQALRHGGMDNITAICLYT